MTDRDGKVGEQQVCPKCSGRMEVGIVLGEGGAGSPNRAEWIEGPVERGRVAAEAKSRLPVSTYRCAWCGYLESYARRSAG